MLRKLRKRRRAGWSVRGDVSGPLAAQRKARQLQRALVARTRLRVVIAKPKHCLPKTVTPPKLRLLHEGTQPLIYRCNVYRLNFRLRQDTAEGHAN
jgi:hypothetical protein